MKLISTIFLTMFSLTSFGATETLSFNAPDMKVKQLSLKELTPLPINLIRLYQKLPSERRMIAGVYETRHREVSYLDSLREKLLKTNGKIRL